MTQATRIEPSRALIKVAALVLTLASASAIAGEPADAAPAQASPAQAQNATGKAPQAGKQERVRQLGSLIVLGAVADPHDADWVDDSTLPELPVVEMADDASMDAAQPGAVRVASATN